MEHDEATIEDLPRRPRWRWTRWEATMLVGLPIVTYVGGMGSAVGSVAGLVLAAFAAAGALTFAALRMGRTNQPRMPRSTPMLAVAVAVAVVVTAWNLFHFAPHDAGTTTIVPALPVVAFGVLAATMRWGRR